ncbi:MAG: FIST C-terminal domain-containing protein [Sulfuricella sp.]
MPSASMHYLENVGEKALREVLNAWRASKPKTGVFAMLPEAERAQIPLLQKVCAEEGVPLVGAVFPALVQNGEFRSCGLWLLRFDEMPRFALLGGLKDPGADAAASIAAAVSPHLGVERDTLLFMVFDSMIPNISTILDGLYLLLADRVRYAGVNAGSETFQPMPCLFDATRIIGDGVLLLVLEHHAGAVLEHGYKAPEHLITATSTEGNRIFSIDWRPAFEVYQEVIREQFGVAVTPENFYQYASHFPFGIVRADNEVVVRIPVAVEKDGSVFCVGEVPANAMLTLLRAPEVDSGGTVEALVNGLSRSNGALPGRDLLLFYCAGRRLCLGEQARKELAEVARRTGAGEVAGALSLGEIGSSVSGGYPLFHNATLVGTCWR